MLMRSMPSVYSPSLSSGITTSSLILKALVWREIGRGARAVQPETLPLLRGGGDEAFAVACVGEAHDLGGRLAAGVLVVAHDVGDEDHARATAALRLGGVADRFHVALVQVLEAGQDRLGVAIHVVLDLHDRRHRLLHVAEEFQAHRAHVPGHAMQDEGGRRDEAVAAFLLNAGKPREPLVGHVLAEPFLAQALALDLEHLLALGGDAVGFEAAQAKARHRCIVDAAPVVADALDLEPVAIGSDHAPRGEVVERRAPQHRLLAARVHGDVAADARRVGGRGIDREHEALLLGRFHHALCDDAGAAADHRARLGEPGQDCLLDGRVAVELLDVDHRGVAVERDRPARVTGAAAARDDGEAQVDQRLHDRRALLLRVGVHDDEGIFHAPVGGVRHVRHARHAVELDVVLARDGHEPARDLAPQAARLGELVLEGIDRGARGVDQVRDAVAPALVGAALVDLAQAVAHRVHQHVEAPRAVEEVVLQVRVAAHRPDVAQDLVEHACGAPRHALLAQLLEGAPRVLAQQPDHDLAIGVGRVVVGDFTQAGVHGDSSPRTTTSCRELRGTRILPHCTNGTLG
jgi:hypothetical protein